MLRIAQLARFIVKKLSCKHIMSLNTQNTLPETGLTDQLQASETALGGSQTASHTKFVNDAETVETSAVSRPYFNDNLMSVARFSDNISIEQWFEKPTVVQSGVVTTMTRGSFINGVATPYFASDIYQAKLKGYYGIRADSVWRLEVNAPVTQAGVIGLFFVPFGQDPLFSGTGFTSVLRNLKSIMLLPHVLLDISCETSATLVVPRISPTVLYREGASIKGKFDGMIYIIPLTNLYTGTGSTSFSYQLYVSYQNVKMGAQVWTATAGKKRSLHANITEKEQKQMNMAPISSTLSILSTTAASLANIPIISSFAGPAAWVTRALATTAQAFGFSKPGDETPIHRITQSVAPYLTTVDGIDSGTPMALSMTNKLSLLPGFAGSDLDEMNFAFLFSKPNYIGFSLWQSSQTSGSSIYDQEISPKIGSVLSANANKWIIDSTLMYYIGNMFEMWRGSMILTLKIAKTAQHSGRLRVLFNPTTGYDFNDYPYMLNEIIDVRTANEWEFQLPFISDRQWKTMPNYTYDSFLTTFETDRLGYLSIVVVNPLVGPDTVSGTVECVFSIRPGPDFELAVVRNQSGYPVWKATSGSPCVGEAYHPIADVQSVLCPSAASEYSVGEKIVSLLPLMKRFTTIRYRNDDTAKSNVQFSPFVIFMGDANEDALNWTNYPTGDHMSFIASMYALNRGGVRIKAFNAAPAGSGIYSMKTTNVSLVTFNEAAAPVSIARESQTALEARFGASNTHFGEVTLPGYSSVSSRLTMRATPGAIGDTDLATSTVLTIKSSVSAPNWELYRAASDDYQCGLFYTVPIFCTGINYG